jgi:hypothetical protein
MLAINATQSGVFPVLSDANSLIQRSIFWTLTVVLTFTWNDVSETLSPSSGKMPNLLRPIDRDSPVYGDRDHLFRLGPKQAFYLRMETKSVFEISFQLNVRTMDNVQKIDHSINISPS